MKNVLGMVFIVGATTTLASPARAQGQADLQAMLKWQTAKVIHYDVVAEYSGATPALAKPPNAPVGAGNSQVTDRFEIGFDWDPASMAMIGKAAVKNFPSKVSPIPAGKCAAPTVSGSYDHVEVLDVKTGPAASNSLELSIRRTYPAGVITYPNEKDICTRLAIPARTDLDKAGVLVPLGLFFVMPQAVPANITVGKDGRTMTLKDREWTYTYTLRIIK
jgi:hypothetical protein